MTREPLQSERMESELTALRDAFKEAEINGDTNRMLTISKVIIQYEKGIANQKVQEGITLARETVMRMTDEASGLTLELARKFIPAERYDEFSDALMAALAQFWSR